MTFDEYSAEFDAFWEDPENDIEIDSWMLTYNGPAVLIAYGYHLGLPVTDVENWWADAEDSFTGKHSSDAAFAEDYVEGFVPLTSGEVRWPYYCIDWERAAEDLMADFFSEDGFYFRNV